MADYVAYTTYMSGWVFAMTCLSMVDISSLFIDESAISDKKKHFNSPCVNLSWSFMFFIALVVHLFIFYVYTTGSYEFKSVDEYGYHARYNWIMAFLSLALASNFVGLIFKFIVYFQNVKNESTVKTAGVDGGINFNMQTFDEVRKNFYKSTGFALFLFNVMIFTAFLVCSIVILYIVPDITDTQRGTVTAVLLATGCIIVVNLAMNAFGTSRSKSGHVVMSRYKGLIGNTLKNKGVALGHAKDGSQRSLDQSALSKNDGTSSFSVTGHNQVFQNDHIYTAALLAASTTAKTKEAQDKGINPENFRVRCIDGNAYVVNNDVARELDCISGIDIAQSKSLIGYHRNLWGNPNTNKQSIYPENELFRELAGSGPILLDYDVAFLCSTFFTHEVCGVGTGIGYYMNLSYGVVGPFFWYMLPFYMYFLMSTEKGMMAWIITMWPAFLPALYGRFGQFWELFLYSFLIGWITIIGIHYFIPSSDNYVFNYDAFYDNTTISGMLESGGTSLDDSATFVVSVYIAFALSICGFIDEIRKLMHNCGVM